MLMFCQMLGSELCQWSILADAMSLGLTVGWAINQFRFFRPVGEIGEAQLRSASSASTAWWGVLDKFAAEDPER